MAAKLALATESNRFHSTDEAWQIFEGLGHNGYHLAGYGLDDSSTNVYELLNRHNPTQVVIQDIREWDVARDCFREPRARFLNPVALKNHPAFKCTILKDCQHRPKYHKQAADDMGINAHIIYYDEEIVRSFNPWIGKVIRTWHTLNKYIVPNTPTCEERHKVALLSGALSGAYPLRERLRNNIKLIPEMDYLIHPGYNRDGCHTPYYLQTLSQYRISICTCSVYNYALRKIVESTACGCRVITNLPKKYHPPGISGNLFVVHGEISPPQMRDVIMSLNKSYDPVYQAAIAERCKELYDFRVVTKKLVEDIDKMAGKEY